MLPVPVRAAVLVVLLAASAVHAQTAVEGTVTDTSTGEALIGASVALLGPGGAVVGGTTTNADGRFALSLVALPADLAVRYIGYETARVRVTSAEPLEIRLAPDESVLGEAVVTPGEDPARALLRRVVARTRAQRAALGPYAVAAYTRTTIYTPSGEIRGVVERASDAYWAPSTGWREVVVAARRTENLGAGTSVAAVAGDLVDLLAPDVTVAGHRLVGPTHPDALDVYDAEIVGNAALDGKLVVRLALRTHRATASAFVGTLDVLFDSAVVVAADLRPGPSFLFPPPVRIDSVRYRQQYVPVRADSSLWLPADLRSEFRFGIAAEGLLSTEPFRVETTSQLSSYRLGAVAPDTLTTATRRAARLDSTRLEAPGVAPPLTDAETAAYAAGDSLGSLEDVLVFHGPLAGIARGNIVVSAGGGSDSTAARSAFGLSFGPRVQINPAEQVRLGLGVGLRAGPLRAAPRAAFRLSDTGVSLGAEASLQLVRFRGEGRTLSVVGGVSDGVARRVVSTAPALGQGFLDGRGGYYRSTEAAVGLRLEVGGLGSGRNPSSFTFGGAERSASVDLRFVSERAKTFRPGVTDSDLLYVGPADASQTVSTFRLDAAVGTLESPEGLVPRQAVRVIAERSVNNGLRFSRAEALLEARISTFARRRALAPALDVRLSGGVSTGDLPLFRQFALEHALGDGGVAVTTFGALRSRTDTPDAGGRYVMLAYEHSFRTIPFELVGLHVLARRGYNVILSGAHGRTWGGTSTGFTHEVGVSLSGLLTGLRIDLTQRLGAPGTVVGFSLARLL